MAKLTASCCMDLEEREIIDHFIQTAFPRRLHSRTNPPVLAQSSTGLSIYELQRRLNLSFTILNKALKLLSLESPAPVLKQDNRWTTTASRLDNNFWERVHRLTELRRFEQAQMIEYCAQP